MNFNEYIFEAFPRENLFIHIHSWHTVDAGLLLQSEFPVANCFRVRKFHALYAKSDCETQNQEGGSEAV
jgi:hypothetical protein